MLGVSNISSDFKSNSLLHSTLKWMKTMVHIGENVSLKKLFEGDNEMTSF